MGDEEGGGQWEVGGAEVRRRRMEEVWVVGEGDDQHLCWGTVVLEQVKGTVGDEVSC